MTVPLSVGPGNVPSRRMLDLLADRAAFGLEPEEERELAVLLSAEPQDDEECFDRVAAALAVAHQSRARQTAEIGPAKVASGRWPWWPAVALAGCGLLVVAWPFVDSPSSGDGSTPTGRPPHESQQAVGAFDHDRDRMLREVADVVQLACSGIDRQAPSAGGHETPAGDIVWSPSRQRGFLRIRGLPVNDPRREQYAIWIIAGRRAVPVRGGVFSVPPDGGGREVVVPIVPGEFVQDQTLFAITVENFGEISDYSLDRVHAVARVDDQATFPGR